MKDNKGCRNIYRILNEKTIESKSQMKWGEIFQNIELNWKIIYSIPAKSCSNTKLHWFQYRILHRILATNDFLFKIKIRKDNQCSFCQRFPETLEHLFWNCEFISEFWQKIENWINEKSEFVVAIIMYNAIFGITFNQDFNKPINYIIILTKYYIYKCRINNKQLNFAVWKNEVKNSFLLNKTIAIKNNCFENFSKHWAKWINLFESKD